ncbi:hypothetical protein K1719_045245 [Acacia pycnantha]|nr:hypothetical protein K1719_045245 [Acacia pycnantha]
MVTKEDYLIGREGDIPSIEFSKEVREGMTKGMERTLVIKLLGRSIIYSDLMAKTQPLWQPKGLYQLVDMEKNFYLATFDLEEDYNRVLTGGPWMIFGAYLTVQPWSLDFDCNTPTISKVVVWVRIPGLSFRYYHKSAHRAIGSLLGEVVKIDYSTESQGRGKYARIAVLIDLERPLTLWIKVDGRIYGVQYEGLPYICFGCGKYGHMKDKCKEGKQVGNMQDQVTSQKEGSQALPKTVSQVSPEAVRSASPDSGSSTFGKWMQVTYPRKGNKWYLGKEATMKGSAIKGGSGYDGSIYNMLFDCEDLVDNVPQGSRAEIMEKDLSRQMPVPTRGVGRNKVRSNGAQPTQVYRKKGGEAGIKKDSQLGPSNVVGKNPSVEKGTTLDKKDGDGGSGIVVESTNLMEEDKGPIEAVQFLSSTFKALESSSSLDNRKHTVVELHRTLEGSQEATPNLVDALVGLSSTCVVHEDGEIGKENLPPGNNGGAPSHQGIKLQTSIKRNLKVRKKQGGKHMSKDAMALLRAEMDVPHDSNASGCSSDSVIRPIGPNIDPSGSGMSIQS